MLIALIIVTVLALACAVVAIEALRIHRYVERLITATACHDWDEVHRLKSRAPVFGFRHADHREDHR